MNTARHRLFSRSRPPRRRLGAAGPAPRAIERTAIQVFLFHLERFMGTELFGADRPLLIGRHPGASLRLEGQTVSRRHCRIVAEGETLSIEDLGSANGTVVDQSPLRGKLNLRQGDAVQIGPYTLRIKLLRAAAPMRVSATCSPDTVTRVEAILSASGTDGSKDQALDLGQQLFDRRLYEEAIRRTTGGEAPRNVIPLRAPATAAETDPEPILEHTPSTRGPGLIPHDIAEGIDARLQAASPRGERRTTPDRLPPVVDAEGEDLDWCSSVVELMPELSEMSSAAFERYLAKELNRPAGAGSLQANTRGDRPSILGRLDSDTQPPPASAQVGSDRDHRVGSRARHRGAWTQKDATDSMARSGPTVDFDDEARDGRQGVLARLVTPSDTAAAKIPDFAGGVETEATVEVPVCFRDFAGIEISARVGERVAQTCVLRKPGEQYVLGHESPEGERVPFRSHRGLRLLRITQDRQVDLVFPESVGGHLVREGTTVSLHELTEGRKYSCLKLKPRDIVTVILGDGPNVISYHVRFIHAPAFVLRTGS